MSGLTAVGDLANTLVSGAIGIAGVAVGAGFQYRMERARERRQRLYVPAAEMAKKLRGAASSLDYAISGLVRAEPMESDALPKAKHYIWEADATRAGIEFGFSPSQRVSPLAKDAVDRLKEAHDVAADVWTDPPTAEVAQRLNAAKSAYDAAIDSFVDAAQRAANGGRW